MKKLLLILLFATASSYAGQKAVTDTGEEVYLNDNGTWEYTNKPRQKKSVIITTNKKRFTKPKGATFLLKSKVNNSAFWFNTNEWRFSKAKTNADAEYEFQLREGDLYALAITEGISIPLDSLAEIAVSNARANAPDAKVVKKEYRYVNGKKLIYMETEFSVQGVKFTYLGYYSSDKSGSTQLIAYTASYLVDKYRPEVEKFLNGLITR